MKNLNNTAKTLGYFLILDVNPNLYSRNNPKSWFIHTFAFIERESASKRQNLNQINGKKCK